MSTPNNGGPAFPIPHHEMTIEGQTLRETQGMSLRDWFAGQIAPTIWREFQEDGTSAKFPEWKNGVAIESYRIADAMLAEREKGGEE